MEFRMPKGDKYIDLTNYLKNNKDNNLELAFREIETILGFKLPTSARLRQEWWGNDHTHSQAVAWQNAATFIQELDAAQCQDQQLWLYVSVPVYDTPINFKGWIPESETVKLTKDNVKLVQGDVFLKEGTPIYEVNQFNEIKSATSTNLTHDVRGRIEKRQESFDYHDSPGGWSFWVEEKYLIFPKVDKKKNGVRSLFKTFMQSKELQIVKAPPILREKEALLRKVRSLTNLTQCSYTVAAVWESPSRKFMRCRPEGSSKLQPDWLKKAMKSIRKS